MSGLLERGWHVFAGQHRPDWPELISLSTRYPDALHIIPLEVRSMQSVQAAVQTVSGVSGHLDMLINNAGVGSPLSSRSIREPQDYDDMHPM